MNHPGRSVLLLSVQTWNRNCIWDALFIPVKLSKLNIEVVHELWFPSPNTPNPLPLAPLGTEALVEIVEG